MLPVLMMQSPRLRCGMGRLCQPDIAQNVGVERAPDLLFRDVFKLRLAHLKRRVVHQNVQPAQLSQAAANGLFALLDVAHVELHDQALALFFQY